MIVAYLHPVFETFRWWYLDYDKTKYTPYQPLPIRSYPVFQFRLGTKKFFKSVEPDKFFKLAVGRRVLVEVKKQRRKRYSSKYTIINNKMKKKEKTIKVFLYYPAPENTYSNNWLVIWEEKFKPNKNNWTMTTYERNPKVIASGENSTKEKDFYLQLFVALSEEPNKIEVLYYTAKGMRVLRKIMVPP